MVVMGKNRWQKDYIKLVGLILIAAVLYLSYHFKEFNFAGCILSNTWQSHFGDESKMAFVFNRVLRFIINELLGVSAIQLLFNNRKFTTVAFVIFSFGLFVFLPLYFWLDSISPQSPITVMLHRITFNPVLIIILIPAFLYQKKSDGMAY
jgi:exosortase F-associated protein